MRVPFVSLDHTVETYEKAEMAIKAGVENKSFILGSAVAAFEQEFAEFTGSFSAIGVASGTDALVLALEATKHKLNRTSKLRCWLAPNAGGYGTIACLRAGVEPVYVDVDADSGLIGEAFLQNSEVEIADAIIVTHLYGSVVDVERIRALHPRLIIIEDCSQAHGASLHGRKVGSLGDFGTFSFYPSKNLGAIGDGGAVTVRSNEDHDLLVMLRQYGWRDRYDVAIEGGMNSRLDEIQATYLRYALKNLDEWNIKRERISLYYDKNIARADFLNRFTEGSQPVVHLKVLKAENRDGLIDTLRKNDIGFGIHFPILDYEQNAWEDLSNKQISTPNAKELSQMVVSLPMYPNLSEDQAEHVCEVVNGHLAS